MIDKFALRSRGTWFVIVLLAIGCVLAALTWRHYVTMNPSTTDAVLIVSPRVELQGILSIGHIPSTEKEQTELEIGLLIEDFDSARKAIEHALTMVEEQKENFNFAQERYERLMPLVETGALDQLSASQIQSAYIAARASLAQAKYFLVQAMRDYGTPEYRSARLKLLRGRLPVSEEAATTELPSATVSGATPQGVVEAVFMGTVARQLSSGMLASITFSNYPKVRLQGRVSHVDPMTVPGSTPAVRVKIPVMNLPAPLQDRKTIACQVMVDMSVPKKN